MLDSKGFIVECNRGEAELYGYSQEELIGKHITDLMKESSLDVFKEKFRQVQHLHAAEGELSMIRSDGSIIYVWRKGISLTDQDGNFAGALGYDRDITDRKRAEEQIEASLKEKEVLLREIHHRVKNDLTLVCSLLNLQSGYAPDEAHVKMFDDLEARVRSMAMAHEKLYQSESLADLKVPEYLSGLVDHLVGSIGIGSPIEFRKEIEDVSFGLDTAVPLGMVLMELVSNCMKHAFPDGRKGEIRIFLRSIGEKEFELVVSDNGVGIREDIDLENSESLGLDLVNSFVEKLRGSIEILRDNGTEVRVRFEEI